MTDCAEECDLIDIQIACFKPLPFSLKDIRSWVGVTLKNHNKIAELTLRFVDIDEIHQLNQAYRNKDKPTNVLAFPSNLPASIKLDYPLLGDIIICPAVLEAESLDQNIDLKVHWAHIIIHGVLHLLGYDHIKEQDALIMQAKEVSLLATFGFANPYHQEDRYCE